MQALLLAAWIGCQGLDIGTTYAALHSGRFVEANPVLRGPQLYSLKISINVGMLIWHEKAMKQVHPYLIPAMAAGAGCAAGVLNLHTMAGAK